MLKVSDVSDDELDQLRKRKLSDLQRQMGEEDKQGQIQQQLEQQKQALLRSLLSPEARQRLTNLRMVRPEFTDQIELQLIQIAQQRKLPTPLSDAQLKQILSQLQNHKREIKIRRL
jgi:programmed cell death protein 5